MARQRSLPARLVLLALALFGLVVAPAEAWAKGSVTVEASTVQESSTGRWKLKFTINYGSKPTLPFIPVIFSFKPTMLYERSLTDQSPKTPVITKKPLQNQTENNVSTDVSFSDPASGEVFTTTKFSIDLRRDRGFEAGEYTLTVRLAEGGTLGSTTKIILQGDNPIVDRRAISFVEDTRPKPKPSASAASTGESGGNEPPPAPVPTVDTGSLPPSAPPSVAPGAKGCGCWLAATSESPAEGWLGLGAVGLLLGLARLRRHAA